MLTRSLCLPPPCWRRHRRRQHRHRRLRISSTLINHPAAYTQVAELKPQSVPSRLGQGAPVWSEPQYDRRIPGNAGDTSYGGDWAETWGGP